MKIELLSLTQTALIVPGKTGLTYTNQVGGTECEHPEIEGSLVPIEYDIQLENPEETLTLKICKLFPEGTPGVIEQSKAEMIQELLNFSPYTRDIKIDWNKIKESKESWLYVKINGTLDNTIESEATEEAILTWPNSD